MNRTGPIAVVFSFLVCVVGSTIADPGGAVNPCRFRPWDSVDNGMGAEPGVTREFATGMTVPSDCLSNGRVFVPIIDVALTRTAAGPSDFNLDVFIREAQKGNSLPGSFRTPTNMVSATGVPVFPTDHVYEFPTLPAGDSNVNNLLWGDDMFLCTAWSGDTQGVFLVADQTGPPGATQCFTGLDGAVPFESCLNGNPNLNAPGLGATGYTYYARYGSGDQVFGDNREPLPTVWGARYLRFDSRDLGVTTNLRVRDGLGGPAVCEYLNIPIDFEFDCALTAGQTTRLENGGVYVELEVGGVPEVTRVYPAGVMVFVDSFESAGTSVWSSTVP
jgi:hypothetical protein